MFNVFFGSFLVLWISGELDSHLAEIDRQGAVKKLPLKKHSLAKI